MATATAAATIHAFVMLETSHARAHGSAYAVIKSEAEALNELIRQAKDELASIQATAVDLGFAERKEVWTDEHVVKGHFKRRFTWIKE